VRVSRSASVSECECHGVRVSQSASVSQCKCLGVQVSRSASRGVRVRRHEGRRRKGRRRQGRRCLYLCVCMRNAGVHVLGGGLVQQSAYLLLCPPRRDVMAALGCQPLRRAEQPARCSWTPCIVRQVRLTGGEAVGGVGEGRAEGEHSSKFSCRFCHWIGHKWRDNCFFVCHGESFTAQR